MRNNIYNGLTLYNSASTIEYCEMSYNDSEGIQVFANSTVSIIGSNISNNTSHGLMCLNGPEVTVDACTISNNGINGIFGENVTLYITDNNISSNTASGVLGEGCTLEISDNDILGNTNSGIRIVAGIVQSIDSNLIGQNSAANGGGIYCQNCEPVITNNEVSCNGASGSSAAGGGIYLFGCGDGTTLSGNTVSGNSSSYIGYDVQYCYGGGVYSLNSSVEVHDNNFIDNFVTGDANQTRYYLYGGGFYGEGSNVVITSNVFQQNSVYGGGTAWWYYNYGGGVSVYSCSALIEGNYFIDNSVYGGTNFMVSNDTYAGGLYCNAATVEIIDNEFIGNIADQGGGGGLRCKSVTTASTINANTFSENTASWGAGIDCEDCDIEIEKNLVVNNNGEGIRCYLSDSHINNCTIYRNSLNGIHLEQSASIVENTIITNSELLGGIRFIDSPNALIQYSDFHNNTGGNFYGSPPSIYLGMIVTVNANGDSCDAFSNVFSDPLFDDPSAGNFQITWENFPVWDDTRSPCIDAGNPDSTLDPDGTVSDLGVLYFDQWIPVVDDLVISIDGEDVILEWGEIAGAALYNVYRWDEPYFDIGGMIPAAAVAETAFTDEGAVSGGPYYYIVTWESE